MRSYLVGSTPENNYTPVQPYRVTVSENTYSRPQFVDGYLTLYVACSGADTVSYTQLDVYKRQGYIANEFQKLDIYKRIAGMETEEEKDEMLEELIDRFGEPPKSVLSLLRVARLKAVSYTHLRIDSSSRPSVVDKAMAASALLTL